MLYSVLIYGSETVVDGWSKQEESTVMTRHDKLRQDLGAAGKLGPAFRLMPSTTAVTVRGGGRPVVIDGPFIETKEQLLGVYVIDCATLDEAIAAANRLTFETGVFEIRPLRSCELGRGERVDPSPGGSDR